MDFKRIGSKNVTEQIQLSFVDVVCERRLFCEEAGSGSRSCVLWVREFR